MTDSFLEGHGSNFPQKDLVIVHAEGGPEEHRTSSRAIVQSASGMFNVNTPIYEGDIVEVPDPRGGIQRLHVTEVKIVDVQGEMGFHGMSHIEAHWSEKLRRSSTTTYNAPVVNVHGDHAQVAWDNQSVTQNSVSDSVAPGYDDLAQAVTKALELLSRTPSLDPDDQVFARESAEQVPEQLVTTEPNPSIIRRGLAALRGVLLSASESAAGSAASEAIKTLITALSLSASQ